VKKIRVLRIKLVLSLAPRRSLSHLAHHHAEIQSQSKISNANKGFLNSLNCLKDYRSLLIRPNTQEGFSTYPI